MVTSQMRWLGLMIIFLSFPSMGEDQSYAWSHFGAKSLAMGNASVAVPNGCQGIFHNPAILAMTKHDQWGARLGLLRSSNATEFIQKIPSLSSSSDVSVEASIDLLESHQGKHYKFLSYMNSCWQGRAGRAIGIVSSLGGILSIDGSPSILADIGQDTIIPVGTSRSFLSNRVKIGATVKLRLIDKFSDEITIELLTKLKDGEGIKADDFFVKGYGIGLDFGIIFSPLVSEAPNLGFSITDIGGTRFYEFPEKKMVTRLPRSVGGSLNVGFSARPIIIADRRPILIAIDVHGVNKNYSFTKKLQLGMEWTLIPMIKLLSGFHQGYFSWGLEFSYRAMEINLATYTEEMGSISGQDPLSLTTFELGIEF